LDGSPDNRIRHAGGKGGAGRQQCCTQQRGNQPANPYQPPRRPDATVVAGRPREACTVAEALRKPQHQDLARPSCPTCAPGATHGHPFSLSSMLMRPRGATLALRDTWIQRSYGSADDTVKWEPDVEQGSDDDPNHERRVSKSPTSTGVWKSASWHLPPRGEGRDADRQLRVSTRIAAARGVGGPGWRSPSGHGARTRAPPLRRIRRSIPPPAPTDRFRPASEDSGQRGPARRVAAPSLPLAWEE
jgi:hypothetical protein